MLCSGIWTPVHREKSFTNSFSSRRTRDITVQLMDEPGGGRPYSQPHPDKPSRDEWQHGLQTHWAYSQIKAGLVLLQHKSRCNAALIFCCGLLTQNSSFMPPDGFLSPWHLYEWMMTSKRGLKHIWIHLLVVFRFVNENLYEKLS